MLSRRLLLKRVNRQGSLKGQWPLLNSKRFITLSPAARRLLYFPIQSKFMKSVTFVGVTYLFLKIHAYSTGKTHVFEDFFPRYNKISSEFLHALIYFIGSFSVNFSKPALAKMMISNGYIEGGIDFMGSNFEEIRLDRDKSTADSIFSSADESPEHLKFYLNEKCDLTKVSIKWSRDELASSFSISEANGNLKQQKSKVEDRLWKSKLEMVAEFFEVDEEETKIHQSKALGLMKKKSDENSDSVSIDFFFDIENDIIDKTDFVTLRFLSSPESVIKIDSSAIKFYKKKKLNVYNPLDKNIAIFTFLQNLTSNAKMRRCLGESNQLDEITQMILNKLVLSNISEVSILGSTLLMNIIKDPEYNHLVIKNGGLNILLRQSLARNRLVSNNSFFSIAALVKNVGVENLQPTPKEKELLIRVLFAMASQLHSTGNYNHALLALKDCLKLDGNNINCLSFIVTVYNKLKEFDKANDCYRTLIDKIPHVPDFRYGLAESLYRKGGKKNNEEAVKQLIKAIDINPDSSSYVFLLADILNCLQRNKEANYYLRTFCESKNGVKDAKAFIKLGESYLKNKESASLAKKSFMKAVEITNSLENQQKYIACLVKIGELNEAKQICTGLLKKNPSSSRVLELAGKVFKLKGDWSDMESCYRTLETQRSLDISEHFLLATALENQNKINESQKIFLQALRAAENKSGSKLQKAEKLALRSIFRKCTESKCSDEMNKMISRLSRLNFDLVANK